MTAPGLKDPTVVIGLDFGTTYSGFSYALWRDNRTTIEGFVIKACILLVVCFVMMMKGTVCAWVINLFICCTELHFYLQ
jgi:hypothetical protein